MLIVDELRREIIVTGLFRHRRIEFRDVEWVGVRRSWLLDSLPNPNGAVIPAYEVLVCVRGGKQIQVEGGTSLIHLRSQAADIARLLRVPLHEPEDSEGRT
jgi:hypothetical protein